MKSLSSSLREKYIGDSTFYRSIVAISLPIIIQNGITNFVNMLDNLMVGGVGTYEMTGVSIANQLYFVFYICIFGATSGAGIFAAQYFGAGDHEGVRQCFRFKLIVCFFITLAFVIVFGLFDTQLITLYLPDASENSMLTLGFGRDYLRVILIGFWPYMVTQIYATTLRETGHTALPMIAGLIAVIVNLVFNALLIYGKLGFPRLGVTGAAIATVMSRFVEVFIVIFISHRNKLHYVFVNGLYRTLKVPISRVKSFVIKGMPLLVNEALWAGGTAVLNQQYAQRGLEVTAAINISGAVYNLFSVIYMSIGSGVAIIIGQELGAGHKKEARDKLRKLIFCCVLCCTATGLVMAAVSPIFPMFYKTEAQVRTLSTQLLLVISCCMPMYSYVYCCYYTLRSGGRTVITFCFDSVFMCIIKVPIVYAIVSFTDLHIVPVYIISQAIELIKLVIGNRLVASDIWIQNIVEGS